MWFDKLMGFDEESLEQVQQNIELKENALVSKVNGKSYTSGKLTIPLLNDLINEISLEKYNDKITLSEVVGNAQDLHLKEENNYATFQVASQFNLLEMVSPNVTPEKGVDGYYYDHTQGPVCAIACGAGTIFRNYFVEVNGEIGQTKDNQIDCLKDIGEALGNKDDKLWRISNGYALATEQGLEEINSILNNLNKSEYEALKGKLRIGVHQDTEVTLSSNKNLVTQCYCSALPVAYTKHSEDKWELFSRLILEATYEATFYAALQNYERNGNNKLFLTFVGGGVFGNKREWILDAINKSILKFSKTPLDVKLVSYGASNPLVRSFIENVNI